MSQKPIYPVQALMESGSGGSSTPDKLRPYQEQSSIGLDSMSQGVSTNPFGGLPNCAGLRVPMLASPNRYLFLLSTHRVQYPGCLVHKLRQLATLICYFTSAGVTSFIEVDLTSVFFQFPDGNISWHLVLEPDTTIIQRSPLEAPSFAYYISDTPALLFDTGTWAAGFFDVLTGAPLFYDQGMLTYAPPTDVPNRWLPVPGYGDRSDIFCPWRSDTPVAVQVPVPMDSNYRISLYASVLQTNPATRPIPSGAGANQGPDWGFIDQFPAGGGEESPAVSGVVYGRVGGAMLVEQLEDDDPVFGCKSRGRMTGRWADYDRRNAPRPSQLGRAA
jgi:hypothetical protein